MGREATGGNVTERPILFSGAMVRAILQGQKQQTRRVVRGVEECPHGYDGVVTATVPQEAHLRGKHCFALASGESLYLRSPYGSAGDRLWVRETWRALNRFNGYKPRDIPESMVAYAADTYGPAADGNPIPNGRMTKRLWPAIFMPRWACRLVLEVTSVRVERLQAISQADAKAEGVEYERGEYDDDVHAYRGLWNSLNWKRGFGWDVNPWVWVVEFRRFNAS